MKCLWGQLARRCLRRPDIDFGRKLEFVKTVISKADILLATQLMRALLESAIEVRPSKKELFYLCEASESSAMIAEYLRGFFLMGTASAAHLEMASQLEQVLSFRLDNQHDRHPADLRLHQTVATYLLKNRN